MTIGIGFLCSDGITILADTQVSNGSMKYYESKIHWRSLTGSGGRCATLLTYAGNPILWKKFRDKFDGVVDANGYDPTATNIEASVSEILTNMGILHDAAGYPDLYLLCGISCEKEGLLLLKSQAEAVHRVTDSFDAVGCGDTSLIRFLVKNLMLKNSGIGRERARKIGTYVLLQAKNFVSGCGGDTEIFSLTPLGQIEDLSGMAFNYENRVAMAEDAFRCFYTGFVVGGRDIVVDTKRLESDLKNALG